MIGLWRRHPFLTGGLVAALALTLFFGLRFVAGAIYWSGHRELPVEGWMTLGYVGHSWGLDPRALGAAAGIAPPQGHPLPLEEIARRRGVPEAVVIGEVEAAVAGLRAAAAAGAP